MDIGGRKLQAEGTGPWWKSMLFKEAIVPGSEKMSGKII